MMDAAESGKGYFGAEVQINGPRFEIILLTPIGVIAALLGKFLRGVYKLTPMLVLVTLDASLLLVSDND